MYENLLLILALLFVMMLPGRLVQKDTYGLSNLFGVGWIRAKRRYNIGNLLYH